ncbi:MAG: sulfite exporter TauE/SafE family protein [Phycisphaerae bacterium]|nr:sulfite exporter TauE/SafE family protein [Phycisphaerae bacterium]
MMINTIVSLTFMEYAQIGGTLFAAAFLQSIAGFGFSLVLLPVLLSLDVMLAQAVTLGIVCSTAQRVYFIRTMHDHIDWKTLKPMIIIGLAILPAGVAILHVLTSIKIEHVRQLLGVFIVLTLSVQFFRIPQRNEISRFWGYLAAFFSGLLNGIGNIGGAPIVLWILAHNWSAMKMRVTTLAYSLVFVPFQLLLLVCVFRQKALLAGGISLAYIPLVLVGTWCGLWVGQWFNKKHIRIIMQILLLIIAVFLLLQPILKD